MKPCAQRTIFVGIAVVSLLAGRSALGQNTAASNPPMVEDVFKNVQLLKQIPVNQFMETMGFFSASLGADCTYCHVGESGGSWEKYADDNAHKRTARRMIQMVTAINRDNFGGRQVVTCYTCHRGVNRPKVTPSLAALYGEAPPEEPDDVIAAAPGQRSVDQVLDRYIQSLGGTEGLNRLTSFVAKGTYQGYDDPGKRPVEIFAKAPGQRAMVVHAVDGDSSTIFDGRSGWIAAPTTLRPVAVVALAAGDLEAVKLEAQLAFPARLKQALTGWRVGLPTTIDDRDVEVVQGTTAGGVLATFYFDAESGLLTRFARYVDSPVGRIPTQIDYSDYRDVSGVKMPFRWTMTWLDGRSTIELSDVQPNAAIDSAKFGQPRSPR
jgi:outer membrane lipoprotein-sorting protein